MTHTAPQLSMHGGVSHAPSGLPMSTQETHLRLSPAHPGMLSIIASTCSLHLHRHTGASSPRVAWLSCLNRFFPPKRPSRRRRDTAQGEPTLTRGLAHAYSKILAAVPLGKPVTSAAYVQGRPERVLLGPPAISPLCWRSRLRWSIL